MSKELDTLKSIYSLDKIFDIAVHQGNKIVDIREDYENIKSALEYKEKFEKVWEIIKKHKLLNYVLKNKKCADMYKLTDEEIDLLKELEK